MNSSRLRNPLAQVRGLGSAKDGLHHWWLINLTSIALVPLLGWLVVSTLTHLLHSDRAGVAAWISSPTVALTLIACLITLIIHCKLGLQVVIEDYVHCPFKKLTLLLTNLFVSWALALAAVFSIIKLHFIGI
jgi:succinate dehydrogenase / fumarate reductase, membrane anchor subunit